MANAVGAVCIDKKNKKNKFFIDFLNSREIHNLVANENQHKAGEKKVKPSDVQLMMDNAGDVGIDWIVALQESGK
ncbi:MAG: hypothetical protein EBR82_38920 [Caulobacteraceae bacterium]|nr:hypothetical protein [Caulobacteraceae bacterium]